MQWIGETIDAPMTGSLDTDIDQIAIPFGRDLLHVLQALQKGDFSVRMAGGHDGLSGQIADAVNVIAAANQRVAQQIERIGEEVGREGRARQHIKLALSGGGWSEMEVQLNRLIDNLLWPTAVTQAAAAFAQLHDAAGAWKDAADSVNAAASSMSTEVRNITDIAALERRIAEGAEELARSRDRLRDSEDGRILALAAGKMGSWEWNLATGHCLWDAGQRQIFGVFGADHASFEVDLPNVRRMVDRNDWKMMCRQLKRARRNGGAWQLEFRVRRADGGLRWCLGTAVAARDAAGRISRIRGITMDITERKEAEDCQSLLAREVDHRAKNALAVVHAIVSLTRADDIEQFSAAVEGRIHALARAHGLLSDSRWRGAKIADLVQGELAPLRTADLERIRMSGRSLTLHPSAVQALALAVHELADNAVRHGALSAPFGSVHVAWEQHGDELALQWSEFGGPQPQEGLFQKEGLGMRIIRASVETQLRGAVMCDWRPEGLLCFIRVPCHPKAEMLGDFLYSIQNPGTRRRTTALS